MTPLLILHGWGSCAKNWAQIKNLLEKQGYKVFSPDLPGFGESSPLLKSWTLDDYAEWLNRFCEKNNLSQVFLLGHSFGGAIAAKFALKYPEKIKKMFLLANSGIRRKTLKKEILKKMAVILNIFSFLPFFPLMRKIIYKIFIPKSDYPYIEKGIMEKTFLKVINEDISSCFSKIKIPTVIIWGEKDNITPLSDAYFINKEIKNSELKILPQIGHCLHEQAQESLVEKILEAIN